MECGKACQSLIQVSYKDSIQVLDIESLVVEELHILRAICLQHTISDKSLLRIARANSISCAVIQREWQITRFGIFPNAD